MSDHPVSRRTVAIALVGGVVGAKLAAVVAATAETNRDDRADVEASQAQGERQLLSPLVRGARILSWEVLAIEPLTHGAVRVELRGDSGAAFHVEVLARDASPLAARPPAETDKFALYVSNGGDGRTPTAEEQGLAAMALAQLVARNEGAVSDEGFLTHRGRIAAHRTALLEDVYNQVSSTTART